VLEKEKRIQEIIEEVSSSDDDSDDECDCNEELSEKEILTKLKLIKDKAKRKAKAEIEFKGLDGKRKSVKTTKSVLSRHPDIGEVMENIVKDADVGADKWRRTGVYIFTGDTKKEKRMTFKKLKEKLCLHYGEKFSYGTVIQLCVHRNKRRMSSARYKGIGNIKYQRPRKGFNLKFNPDTKWSRSLYKCLDQLDKLVQIPVINNATEPDPTANTTSEQPTKICLSNSSNLDESVVREHLKIFGYRRESAQLTEWQKAVNKSAYEVAKDNPNLLYNRGDLKSLAEEKARETYIFKKRKDHIL
jgi:hypothetical protein